MIIARIEGATRVLGAPADLDPDDLKVVGLPICDTKMDEIPFMVSAWKPTPAELARLNEGASVHLWIQGQTHPIVAMTVGPV